jgi:hypothetical protein
MNPEQPKQKLMITTEDGELFQVPPEGSLGLLALGYKGLIAWRQARRQYQMIKKAAEEKEKSENSYGVKVDEVKEEKSVSKNGIDPNEEH